MAARNGDKTVVVLDGKYHRPNGKCASCKPKGGNGTRMKMSEAVEKRYVQCGAGVCRAYFDKK